MLIPPLAVLCSKQWGLKIRRLIYFSVMHCCIWVDPIRYLKGYIVKAMAKDKVFQGLHVAGLFMLLASFQALTPGALYRWPFRFLLPLIAYAVIASFVPALRRSVASWLRPGRFGREEIIAAFSFVVVSSLALSIWYLLAGPDMRLYVRSLPVMQVWMLPLAGLGFAFTNAAMEEATFRGIIMQALDSAFGCSAASLVIQAVLFGLMHYLEGFPNGVWGVVMASVFGLMMGLLRRRAGGMLAPWAAHALTDLTIFIIVAIDSLSLRS